VFKDSEQKTTVSLRSVSRRRLDGGMYDCQGAQRSEMDLEVGVFENSAQKTAETTRVSVNVTTNSHRGDCRRRLDGGMSDCQVVQRPSFLTFVQRPKSLICWWPCVGPLGGGLQGHHACGL
jgi:hypothetical protein